MVSATLAGLAVGLVRIAQTGAGTTVKLPDAVATSAATVMALAPSVHEAAPSEAGALAVQVLPLRMAGTLPDSVVVAPCWKIRLPELEQRPAVVHVTATGATSEAPLRLAGLGLAVGPPVMTHAPGSYTRKVVVALCPPARTTRSFSPAVHPPPPLGTVASQLPGPTSVAVVVRVAAVLPYW